MFSEISASILAGGLGHPLRGAVLTGGGALLKGLDREVAKLLDTDARIGVLQAHPRLAAAPAELLAPCYGMALGLLLYSSGAVAEAAAAAASGALPWDIPWLAKLKGLVEEFL